MCSYLLHRLFIICILSDDVDKASKPNSKMVRSGWTSRATAEFGLGFAKTAAYGYALRLSMT